MCVFFYIDEGDRREKERNNERERAIKRVSKREYNKQPCEQGLKRFSFLIVCDFVDSISLFLKRLDLIDSSSSISTMKTKSHLALPLAKVTFYFFQIS